jgi:hypothetical protein
MYTESDVQLVVKILERPTHFSQPTMPSRQVNWSVFFRKPTRKFIQDWYKWLSLHVDLEKGANGTVNQAVTMGMAAEGPLMVLEEVAEDAALVTMDQSMTSGDPINPPVVTTDKKWPCCGTYLRAIQVWRWPRPK